MEGGDSTRGLGRSCPRALPPAPGWRSSDQADVAATTARIRQPDGHSHRPARAAITGSPRLRWSTDDQAGEFQSWRGPLFRGMCATSPTGQHATSTLVQAGP